MDLGAGTSLESSHVRDKESSEERAPVDTTSHPNPGMHRGYAMSEMAEIQREYLKEPLDETSISSRVNWFGGKKLLDLKDLIDRGISTIETRPRFGLNEILANRVDRTILEMQDLLTRASSIVPGREHCFTIDPHGALMPILRESDSLDKVHIAWMALYRRMGLAHSYLEKYDSQFRLEKPLLFLGSPVSMDPGIYERFPSTKTSLNQLTYLFDNVPHLHRMLPEDYDKDTGYLPQYLEAPKKIRDAFPSRAPSERPSTVYYSAKGELLERPGSFSEGESKGKARDVQLPDVTSSQDTVPTKRVTISVPTESAEDEWEDEVEEPVSTATYWGLKSGDHATFSQATPFKSADEVMVPKYHSRHVPSSSVPGPDLPDPLRGMASAAPYGLGEDSIS
jgi:hypothetical protein